MASYGSGQDGAERTEGADDSVLLAAKQYGEDVEALDHGLIHWVIRRQDPAALRFSEADIYV